MGKTIGTDVTNKKAQVTTKLLGLTEGELNRLKHEFTRAKEFKPGDYVEVSGGEYGILGEKALVLGHTVAKDKDHKPHVFVVVRFTGKNEGVLKYPKNLKKTTPNYIG